jgi:hypothetical protein
MNAHDLALPAADDADGDAPSSKSGLRATRELAQLFGLDAGPPVWSEHPPLPLLPHDPVAFEPPPPLPRASEVIDAACRESLGGDLAGSLF